VWPFDLWLGTTCLAGVSGLLLSYIAIEPHIPVLADDGTPLIEATHGSPATTLTATHAGIPTETFGGGDGGSE
jgi:hypothetical protein